MPTFKPHISEAFERPVYVESRKQLNSLLRAAGMHLAEKGERVGRHTVAGHGRNTDRAGERAKAAWFRGQVVPARRFIEELKRRSDCGA